jgi:hypothetical protein
LLQSWEKYPAKSDNDRVELKGKKRGKKKLNEKR